MKFVDLFAGLGGFHLAAKSLGMECVLACEIDERLRRLYELNFGVEPIGDIRPLSGRDVPPHDLLCAGFPCQPFSKAGEQLGWKDAERGNLFDRVEKILRARKPEFVILENVAHFERHDEGRTYEKLHGSLRTLGYDVRKAKLSPHQFGVPHFRERLFIVARLGTLGSFEFPAPTHRSEDLSIRQILDDSPLSAVPISDRVAACLELWQEFLTAIPRDAKLPSFPIWGMEHGATYSFDRDSLARVSLAELRTSRGSFGEPLDYRLRRDILARVPSHARADVGAFPAWKKAFLRQNRTFLSEHGAAIAPIMRRLKNLPSSWQKLEWNCQGEEREIWKYVIQFRASGVRVKRPSTAPSLVAMTGTQVPIIGWERRYMTVRECARLQSMDDMEHLPAGDSAAAALGNAVNVHVVRLILASLVGRTSSLDIPIVRHSERRVS